MISLRTRAGCAGSRPSKRKAEDCAGPPSSKRKLVSSSVEDPNLVLFRRTIEDAASELVCPLTQALPHEPVTAEDGKIYERAAIERWLRQHNRSPVTREEMGNKLLPALQIRNLIELLVTSNALPTDDADEWKRERAAAEEVNRIKRRAELGSGQDMAMVALWNLRGDHSMEVNAERWFECARSPASFVPQQRVAALPLASVSRSSGQPTGAPASPPCHWPCAAAQPRAWVNAHACICGFGAAGAVKAAKAREGRVSLHDDRYSSPRPDAGFVRQLSCSLDRLHDVNACMRRILIDWLVEVAMEFGLQTKTLYLAVNFLDRYLAFDTDELARCVRLPSSSRAQNIRPSL